MRRSVCECSKINVFGWIMHDFIEEYIKFSVLCVASFYAIVGMEIIAGKPICTDLSDSDSMENQKKKNSKKKSVHALIRFIEKFICRRATNALCESFSTEIRMGKSIIIRSYYRNECTVHLPVSSFIVVVCFVPHFIGLHCTVGAATIFALRHYGFWLRCQWTSIK